MKETVTRIDEDPTNNTSWRLYILPEATDIHINLPLIHHQVYTSKYSRKRPFSNESKCGIGIRLNLALSRGACGGLIRN